MQGLRHRGGKAHLVAAAHALAVGHAHALDRDLGRQVGDLALVRDVEREPSGLVELDAPDDRRHHLARRPLRHRVGREHLLEPADVVRLAELALFDGREVHAPSLAPPRGLGEETREELHHVPVTRTGQHAEAREQLELHAVLADQVGLARVVALQHLAQALEAVGAGDVQLGDEREVVDARDRGRDLEEVGVEQLAQRELRAGDLVAEPHRLHRRLACHRAADRGHRVGEVEQPRVRTQVFHVAGELEEDRDVAQRADDAARPHAVAHRLHHAVARRDREVVAHRVEAAGGDVHDDVVGTLQSLALVGGAGRGHADAADVGDVLDELDHARYRDADRCPAARSRRRGAAACSRSRSSSFGAHW